MQFHKVFGIFAGKADEEPGFEHPVSVDFREAESKLRGGVDGHCQLIAGRKVAPDNGVELLTNLRLHNPSPVERIGAPYRSLTCLNRVRAGRLNARLMAQALLSIGMISGISSLVACSTHPPIVVPEKIEHKVYIPIPTTLVAPVSAIFPLGTTYGQGLGIQQAAIQTCNANLNAISGLKPPSPP